ncbi:MAG: DeoR family transcriptional regulator [Oscillospiraceae bacterium]|nr:DeoR family transcriptional regulator [Oscillospiraceae bacterium]
MTATERRQEIINVLISRRHATAGELAAEYGVSERTIRSDLSVLTCEYPIEPVFGKYGGGFRLAEWFRPGRKVLAREQADAIRKAAQFLDGKDRQALLSILAQFSN